MSYEQKYDNPVSKIAKKVV